MTRNRLILTLGIAFVLIAMAFLFHTSTKQRAGSGRSGETSPERGTANQAAAPAVAHPTGAISNSVAAPPRKVDGPAQARVSAPILTALGKGEQVNFRERLEAITQLGPELSGEEREALYEYLRDVSVEKWLRPGQGFALKNDLLNALQEQRVPPPELTQFLIALGQDPAQPLVMRHYALQHLAPWYAKVDEAEKRQIVGELRAAAQETDQSYAGTALLAMHRIQQENPGVHLPSLANQVLALIGNERADLLTRITAVQLSGQMKLPQARDAIQRLIADEAAPKTLRIAAVAAFGGVPGEGKREFLESVARGSDERLRLAAASALKSQHGSED